MDPSELNLLAQPISQKVKGWVRSRGILRSSDSGLKGEGIMEYWSTGVMEGKKGIDCLNTKN
jgi:hypothetical protein